MGAGGAAPPGLSPETWTREPVGSADREATGLHTPPPPPHPASRTDLAPAPARDPALAPAPAPSVSQPFSQSVSRRLSVGWRAVGSIAIYPNRGSIATCPGLPHGKGGDFPSPTQREANPRRDWSDSRATALSDQSLDSGSCRLHPNSVMEMFSNLPASVVLSES